MLRRTIVLNWLPLVLLFAPSSASADMAVVCIDPGHPSEINSGYTAQNGTNETHIDWVVAQKLERLLLDKGFRVVMTKSREKEIVRNRDRALVANRCNASIMVRLHCDTGTSRGFAVYYPDRKGTVDGLTGPSLDVRGRSRQAAEDLAGAMQKELGSRLHFNGVKGDSQTHVGLRQGALTGSVYSRVPVVTIEMGVLSQKSDARFIKSSEGQDRMAQAISAGIATYLNENPDH